MKRSLLNIETPEIGEYFETLLKNEDVSIEVIVSSDRPEPILYHQQKDEAVLLIEGKAKLWVDGKHVTLLPGDFLHLPAHTPHKVLETQKGTRWLAIHAKAPLC